MDTSKVLRLLATHLLKTSRKYCHTKRFSPRYKTRLNVTKCHACHAKRSNGTFETSKKHPFCRNYHRHGHIAIAWTVANGCERFANGYERLRRVANGCGRKRNVERTHPQPPDPQSETGTIATHSGNRFLTQAPCDPIVIQSFLDNWCAGSLSPVSLKMLNSTRGPCLQT